VAGLAGPLRADALASEVVVAPGTPEPAAAFLTLESFLADAPAFRLGELPTEQPHPRTRGLAELARTDPARAAAVMSEVDREALAALRGVAAAVDGLGRAIDDVLRDGGRVFLCGCGATGRLALTLEALWRQQAAGDPDRVVSLMAGGDAALVRSLEGFEDHAAYGARHVAELGLGADDLFIGCSEGGETSYVIGATEHAAGVTRRAPWFLYCNPDASLRGIERSRRVIENPAIRKLSIVVGPMALSGSTRMQATTVLMLAVGLPLLGERTAGATHRALDRLGRHLDAADGDRRLDDLGGLIEAESAVYRAGDAVLYEADHHAITVLSDTTERAPTFNLTPFENAGDDPLIPAPCYLVIPTAAGAEAAWRALLGRPPRPLAWAGFEAVAGAERLRGFDFGHGARARRAGRLAPARHAIFRVVGGAAPAALTLGDARARIDVGALSLLEEHVALKLALNIHSTLVMARLGRCRSNVMTWVRPSNRKLVDRAIRYARALAAEAGLPPPSYAETARLCFAEMASLGHDESIVDKTVAAIRRGHAARPGAAGSPPR
jgi:N-acetylmuramic acid 6-phosphate etherase